MTFQKQQKKLVGKIIDSLCKIAEYPEEFMPHCVFVKETNGRGEPVFNRYTLVAIDKGNRTCTLENPTTLQREEYPLSSIEPDWLITLWNWCHVMTVQESSEQPLSCEKGGTESPDTYREYDFGSPESWFKEGDLVCLNEKTVDKVRKSFGDAQADYRKDMFMVVCGTERFSGVVRVKDIREDDVQEFPAECLRILLRKEERQFLTAPELPESKNELWAFLFPIDRFERNTSDEEIIADWESDEGYDFPTRKLTPDELAAELNDNDSGYSEYYIRFINY